MIEVDIPGFGNIKLEYLILDYSGTLSVDGILIKGVAERLNKLKDNLEIHIVTADTHGRVEAQVKNINCKLKIISGENQDIQKENYLLELSACNAVAIGNGNNDARVLRSAKVGIAVCLPEGCAVSAIQTANIVTNSITDALDLLLYPDRLKATLRY